jgi:hypothetical protein
MTVALSRSNEAKALGIKIGDPWHLVKDRHRNAGIIVRSSNYTLYGNSCSRRICQLCRDPEASPQPGHDRLPLPSADDPAVPSERPTKRLAGHRRLSVSPRPTAPRGDWPTA